MAVVIVKHASPCGAALAAELSEAYRLALDCDPVSAFGGIVALGGPCTKAVAEAVAEGPQADVVIARSWEGSAIEVLTARRKATRLLEAPAHGSAASESPDPTQPLELRSLGGGFLVQEPDRFRTGRAQWQVATRRCLTTTQWRDLELAWRVCARTTSNAIVVAAAGQAVGVGAGQQSRVEAAEIAVRKAGEPLAAVQLPATRSSRSATVSTSSPKPESGASSSRVVRCAMQTSSLRPTSTR